MNTYTTLLALTLSLATQLHTMDNQAQNNEAIVHYWKKSPLKIAQELPFRTSFLVKYGTEKNIYARASGSQIHIFNMASQEEQNILHGHTGTVNCCASSANNKTIISASYDRTIKIWNVDNNSLTSTKENLQGTVTLLAAENDIFSSADMARYVKIWDISSGTCTHYREFHGGHECSLQSLIMHQGIIHVGLHNGKIVSIDARSNQSIHEWPAHAQVISSLLACKQNGYHISSGSGDHTIKQWDLRNLSGHVQEIKGHRNRSSHTRWDINNLFKVETLLFASDKDFVYVWNIASPNAELITKVSMLGTIWSNCMIMNNAKTKLYVGTQNAIEVLTPTL